MRRVTILNQEPTMNAPIGKSLEPLIGYRIDDAGCVESRMFDATELPEGWVDTPARLPRSCERIVFNGSLIALNELDKNIEQLDVDTTIEPAGMFPSASHAVEHRPADLNYSVEPVRLDYFVVFEANDPPVLELGLARVRCPKA
jgi:hypothetical protein